VGPVTVKLSGTVGAWESTITVVVAVLVPLMFVAVRVYVRVEVGLTSVDAMRVLVLNEVGAIATELAFVTFQERVEVPAEPTMVPEAEKEMMDGTELAGLNVAIDAVHGPVTPEKLLTRLPVSAPAVD